MRIRKYRAYHDKWGWAEPDDIDVWGDGSICVTYRFESGRDKACCYTEKTKELYVMDYTGFKARGREVYEEDIIDCTFADGHHEKGVVKFIDGCFDIVFSWGRDYLKCFTINHAIEIIGNKYDNPELLKT